MSYLPCVEVETAAEPDSSIIWLHGLGANGHDFEPIIPELKLPNHASIRFIFPHAPSIPVTINNGMVMPAWYDVKDMSMDRDIDYEEITNSSGSINELVDREIDRGIDSKRIIIAGFSQGGAVAYEVALSYEKPLAGLMALSSYLATEATIKPSTANKKIPILVCHGAYDLVVPEILGTRAVDSLKAMGYTPEYHSYPMQHAVYPEEIIDISNWIRDRYGL
jgi:phospholipase/carboxylesterase